MTILELLSTSNPEAGLWLAGIAACAGLAIAWRWRMTRRSLRHRALQLLGYGKPGMRPMPAGYRYAAIAAVAVVTVFVLSPVSPGVGDVEPSADVTQTELAPTVIVVELGSESGAIVVMQGNAVEVRLVPHEPLSGNVGTPAGPAVDHIIASGAITVPVDVLPAGME